MKEIIDALRSCSLRDTTDLEILQLILWLGKIPGIKQTLPPGIKIVRARPGWGYSSRAELSYNPTANHYGRANIPGRPMFYGAMSMGKCDLRTLRPLTAHECNLLHEGQQITFGVWSTTQPISVVIFPAVNNIPMRDNPMYNLYRIQTEAELKNAPEYEDVLYYFSSEFCKEVRDENDYKITAVLSSLLMCDDSIDGVMYPSVKASGKYGFNLAIKPESVDSKMVIEFSSEHHVSYCEGAFIIAQDRVCRII